MYRPHQVLVDAGQMALDCLELSISLPGIQGKNPYFSNNGQEPTAQSPQMGSILIQGSASQQQDIWLPAGRPCLLRHSPPASHLSTPAELPAQWAERRYGHGRACRACNAGRAPGGSTPG